MSKDQNDPAAITIPLALVGTLIALAASVAVTYSDANARMAVMEVRWEAVYKKIDKLDNRMAKYEQFKLRRHINDVDR